MCSFLHSYTHTCSVSYKHVCMYLYTIPFTSKVFLLYLLKLIIDHGMTLVTTITRIQFVIHCKPLDII